MSEALISPLPPDPEMDTALDHGPTLLPVTATREPAPDSADGRAGPLGAVVAAFRWLAAGALFIYVLHLAFAGSSTTEPALEEWLYTGILVSAGAICLARAALVPAQRAVWIVAGAGILSWALGEYLFDAAPASKATAPSFTPADGFSLAFYPAGYVAVILLLRARVERFFTTLWLDGLAAALSISAVVAAYVLPPALSGAHPSLASLMVGVAYPLADLFVIAFVLSALAMTGWRPGPVLGVVAAAFLAIALSDSLSLWATATGHTPPRIAFDWVWPVAALATAEAAWRSPVKLPRVNLTGLRFLAFPLLFSMGALGLLMTGLVSPLNAAGYELATAALVLIVVRMALTVLENLYMANASLREALTDALTGLGNRRRLLIEVEAALEAADPAEPTLLVLFDLDGFKRYNDTFGHPAGDALLARLGRSLAKRAEPFGSAFRLGGDEFCVLARARGDDIDQVIGATADALSEQGKGFVVRPSYGSVLIPVEASDITVAFQLADQRLYSRKGERRRSGDRELARDVLMQVLREREPQLDEHVGGVAALARAVSRRLGLAPEEIDQITRAAELHDVGKMAVPDAILQKPDSLDEYELTMVRQHTLIGERILSVAPALRTVAKLVRLSHERWDGSGYPDGLAGDEIPLGSRVIAVCDAYHAMTTDRPYQRAVSDAEALDELRRHAGSQFDPRIVGIVADELSEHTRAQSRLAGREPGAGLSPQERAAAVELGSRVAREATG